MTVEILHGDCIQVMAAMAAAGRTVQSIVTDPPYHLTQVAVDWSAYKVDPNNPKKGATGNGASKRGFMGKNWDGGDIAFRPETWRLAYDLLAPGGMMACFGGSRTHHRLMCAIEDAGFEIRDVCMYIFGSGFPKSRSLLKPAYEPIVLARKPGPLRPLNIDACRVGTDEVKEPTALRNGGIWSSDGQRSERHNGSGTSNPAGRWPPNILHDGSPEVLGAFAAFGERKTGDIKPYTSKSNGYEGGWGLDRPSVHQGDTGSAARFFPALGYEADDLRFMYCAKASRRERGEGNTHNTVKPLNLMRWLVRLITPPGGTVLDCFAGSGTTGLACQREGFDCVLVEREADYVAMARKRLGIDFNL
jgi:site-specific DNA-methyltransferase (adenine-specific)